MTTPDFFTPDADLKAENLELKQSVENLRAEVNRLSNVIAERDWEIEKLKAAGKALVESNTRFFDSANNAHEQLTEAERRGFEAARERIPDPKHYGAFTLSGPVTKERYETFDDYQRSKSQEGQS